MNLFKTLFGITEDKHLDPDYCEALERIENALTGLPHQQALLVSGLALLLAQVAYTDLQVSEDERARMREILTGPGALSVEQAARVESIAVETTVADIVETHIVIRRLNESANQDQKIKIIRSLFHVACVDDVSEAESDRIGEIASALLLPRALFLEIRSEFAEHLSILKHSPSRGPE